MTSRSRPFVRKLQALVAALSMSIATLASVTLVSAQDLDDADVDDRGDSPPADIRDVDYGSNSEPRQTLDIYTPGDPGTSRPAVIFIHGGGFRRGTKSTFRLEGDLARERDWVGFSINYRLDVEPGHPAEVDDVLLAIEWVRANADEYGVDPQRIALWGTSAGGNLAALAATIASGPLTEGERVIAVVAFSGPMDLTVVHDARPALGETVVGYLGCSPTECPDLYASASATTHVSADDPTMFLAHSEREGLPVSVSEDLAGRLEAVAVPVELVVVPGSLHARNLSLRTPGLMDDGFDFLEAVFANVATDSTPSGEESEDDGSEVPESTTSGQAELPTTTERLEAVSDQAEDDSDGRGWVAAVVGLFALSACTAALLVVLRRRR